MAALEFEDVLVTAPTGSGKTWIAREEIRRLIAAGKYTWYTSPLKALTNSKYQEFSAEFGAERVGILTGDRKENPDAPLIVGTTEIYRNQLFDSLRSGRDVRADLVVLDEAHYLADEERGHVWEEAIILSPPRIRLLLLSATIGNADEFARWIEEVRGVRCGVVTRPGDRPVPLKAALLLPDQRLLPCSMTLAGSIQKSWQLETVLAKSGARPHAIIEEGSEPGSVPMKLSMPEMPPATLLTALGTSIYSQLLFFCRPGGDVIRRLPRLPSSGAIPPRLAAMPAAILCRSSSKSIRKLAVIATGTQSSEAELLPSCGPHSCLETRHRKLMSAGLLDAIFATATVAAGSIFPRARWS